MSKKGKIYSVACKDFVTYSDTVFYPGDYLNVIIGPNGTGKSTLVAAIILGMGGGPKLLSRSSQIEDYIKNGKEEAWIEIKIYKNPVGDKITFERCITMNGKSSFKINKQVVSSKDYLHEVSKFNIQISNLCQFLPQDRVQDFAKMNSQEILSSTLSSVCSQEMIDQLQKLKEYRQKYLVSIKDIKENKKKLQDAENRNAQLKEKIDRMLARKQLEEEISICERKEKWLKYLEKKNKLSTIENDVTKAKEIQDRDEKKYNEVKTSSIRIVKELNKFTEIIKREEENSKKHSNGLALLNDECEKYESNIRSEERDLNNKKREILERGNEIKNEEKILEGLTQDLRNAIADCGSDEDNKSRVNVITEKTNGLINQHSQLMEKYRSINNTLDNDCTPELQAVKRRMNSLENVNERKENLIRDNFPDVYKAILWLRQNRHVFQGQIHNPMLLELNIVDPKYAKYLENTVSTKDLLAFTCENKDDVDILIRNLCNDQHLLVNVLHSKPAEQCQFAPKDNIQNLRKFGFFAFLIDLVEGPAPILNYLCQAYSLHRIPVGTEKVSESTEHIPSHIRLYFGGNYRYNITVSKYSGEASSMRSDIAPKNLLFISIDTKEISKCRMKFNEITKKSDKLKNDRTEIERKLTMIEEQRNSLTEEKKTIDRKKNSVDRRKDQVRGQVEKVKRMKADTIDIEEEEAKFKTLSENAVKKLFALQIKKIDCLRDYQKAVEAHAIVYTKSNIFKRENIEIENLVTSAKEAYENSKKLVDDIKRTYETLNSKVNEILRNFKSQCDNKQPNEHNFPFKEKFEELPDNLEALTDLIYEMQSKVNCMLADDKKIIEQYETRQKEIEYLQNIIGNVSSSERKINNEITKMHNAWFPALQRIVDEINTNFGNFMALMDYVGEIKLSRNEEYDYASYGIEIYVQYRNNGRLQMLDRFVQSGGERAVAIAIYTLGLQRLNNVPFRCVDEINQGMDARNARKVFEMLVNETCTPGQSQYFFVTPTLLSNLVYNENITIHIVHNGQVADKNIFEIE